LETNRHTRYQGAILRDQAILLIAHKEHESGNSYWVIPGGGRMDGETAEECVRREMKEETHLDVRVLRKLLDEPALTADAYQRLKTYLCEPIGGEAKPGYEPEVEANSFYSISEVKWFNLRDESQWDTSLITDPITYPQLQRIKLALGDTLGRKE
jgi:ADP-ribose pyrophosphatase YjhB (NUDIX family)